MCCPWGQILERNNAREKRLVLFLVTEILVHLPGRVWQRSTYHGGQEVEGSSYPRARGGPRLQGSALYDLFLQPDPPAAISLPPKVYSNLESISGRHQPLDHSPYDLMSFGNAFTDTARPERL